MEETTNLKLPLLVPNQSQKEITHNEALVILDNLVNNGVKDKDLITPPENPSQNDLYIVGVGATGEWEDKDNQLAFYDNGWRFYQARQGTKYWVNDENCIYVFNMTSWSKFSGGEGGESSGGGEGGGSGATALSQLDDVSLNSISKDDILKFSNGVFTNSKELNNLTGLGINCECDNDNKLAIKSNYVLFDNNGGDSKIKANKSTITQTASHLFQDNYSGRAEFGLIGNDDFSLKVSSDGSEWKEAFVVDKATGNIDFKGEITKNGESISQNIDNNILEKIETITLNYETEIEFTNLDDGFQHKFEFFNIKPSVASYMLCLLGNASTYYTSGYHYSLFYMDNNTPSVWQANCDCGRNTSNIKITLNKFEAWYLNPNIGGYAYFKILSNLSQNGIQYFEGKAMVADNTNPPYMIMGLQHGMLANAINLDRIKFYLSNGNFASGIIKHYIIK